MYIYNYIHYTYLHSIPRTIIILCGRVMIMRGHNLSGAPSDAAAAATPLRQPADAARAVCYMNLLPAVQ